MPPLEQLCHPPQLDVGTVLQEAKQHKEHKALMTGHLIEEDGFRNRRFLARVSDGVTCCRKGFLESFHSSLLLHPSRRWQLG